MLTLKRRFKARRGVALIIAMYTTIILASLGTLFIADMISKSRTLGSYSDSKLALNMANSGVTFAMHYLGDFNDKQNGSSNIWSDSFTISSVNMFKAFSGRRFRLTNTGINSYRLTLDNADRIDISADRRGSFQVDINVKTRLSPDTNDFYSVDYMEFTSTGTVFNGNGTQLIAQRQVITRARRTVNLATNFYQNWRAWELPGAPPPNSNDGTSDNAGPGDDFILNGPMYSAGNSPYANRASGNDTSGSIKIVNSDGITGNNAKFLGSGFLASTTPFPKQQDRDAFVGPTPATGVTNSNGTNIPLPTGKPFGTTNETEATAPKTMLDLYNKAAATISGKSNAVFVVPSNNAGEVKGDGTDTTGYMVEKFKDTAIHHKPGFAVTEIQFNLDSSGNPSVLVSQKGYYSGKTISTATFNPNKIANGVIYVHGGTVQVRNGISNTAGLRGAPLTIVADQGEAFYNSSGTNVTPAALQNATRYNSSSNGPQTFSGGGTYVNGAYITTTVRDTNPKTIFISQADYESQKATQGLDTTYTGPIQVNGKWWWKAPDALDASKQDNLSTSLEQFAVSEGNLSITGDTTYSGGDKGAGLGLIARNYLIVADTDAYKKNTTDCNGDGKIDNLDRQITVQATMLSTNHSLQWEGSTALNSQVPADSYINNLYYDKTGAPIQKTPVDTLLAGKQWSLNLQGTVFAPFIDVDGDVSGNGYIKQQFAGDPNAVINLPPNFPRWTFEQLRNMNRSIPSILYQVINYTDRGALKS